MRCVQRGFKNTDGLKFCGECGNRLSTAALVTRPRPEQFPAKVKAEPERKTLTPPLFVTHRLLDPTEKLDPEQVKEMTGRAFAGVKGIISD
jgi:hypothetical protein